jgi:hypothetical protein
LWTHCGFLSRYIFQHENPRYFLDGGAIGDVETRALRGPADEGFGFDAGKPKGVKTQVAVAFREAATVRIDDEWNVKGRGRDEPECVLKKPLSRRARQEVVTAYDFGNAVSRVVHDHRELIRREAVTARDQKIADFARNVEHGGLGKTVDDGNGRGFDVEADAGGSSALRFGLRYGPKATAASARILGFLIAELWRRLRSANFGTRADTGVRRAALDELIRGGEKFGLARGLDAHRAVPAEPEPLEIAQDDVVEFGAAALSVEVLDAQLDEPVSRARMPVREQKAPSVTEMQKAGRARRQTSDWTRRQRSATR